jgi:putative endonuclease
MLFRKRTSKDIGIYTEHQAKIYLQRQKLKFITQNYRCRFGEIDLIMQEKNYLVFVEVRYRCTTNYGSSSESLTLSKQQRIIKTAWHYLRTNHLLNKKVFRFDIVALSGELNQLSIQWLKNAFEIKNRL